MAQTFTPQGLPVHNESVSAVTATNSVALGETRFLGGEEYIYVYNAGTNQISVGMQAVLSANSGFSVCASSITQYDFPMGVVKHATITNGAYGWLMTRGFSKVQLHADSSAAVSDVLYPAANGLFANAGIAKSAGCAIVIQPVGYVVSAAASGSSAWAYVRLYGT